MKTLTFFKRLSVTAIFLAVYVFASISACAQTSHKITVDGRERSYLLYVPKGNMPKGMIVALHGMNGSETDFFKHYALKPVADQLNYIILSPQALPEQDFEVLRKVTALTSLAGINVAVEAVWGAGLKVTVTSPVMTTEFEMNAHVQDENFIKAIIDETHLLYPETIGRTYILGASFGGFMAYQYAMKHPDQLAGLISISGSMGTAIDGASNFKVPICDFHSVDDEVVFYNGHTEMTIHMLVPVTLKAIIAHSVPTVIDYWVKRNHADVGLTEDVTYHATKNHITATKTVYPAVRTGSKPVWQYTITGAHHSYYLKASNGDCMDYSEEVLKFIKATAHTPAGIADNLPTKPAAQVVAYYNILGQKIPRIPERGIYIVLYDDGSARRCIATGR
jgi:poly(3-hydroxybutyrate) depolymerase